MPKDSKTEQTKIAQTLFDAFNTENVKFMGKGNSPMSVKDAKMTKEISLNFSNNSRYPDKDLLRKDMVGFIVEVENENNS